MILDGMIKTVISALGITPAQMAQVMSLITDIARDRDAFKHASGRAIAELWTRLDRLEQKIDALAPAAPPVTTRLAHEPVEKDRCNGHDTIHNPGHHD